MISFAYVLFNHSEFCSITVKHAPAASRTAATVAGIWSKYACRMLIRMMGFFSMMNQCDIIVNMVIDLEGQTPDVVAGMLTGDVDIHADERIEHDDKHETIMHNNMNIMKSNKHNTNDDASKQNNNNDNPKETIDMESDVNIHVQDIPTERRNELKIMYANVFNAELPGCAIHNRMDGNGWHHVDIN